MFGIGTTELLIVLVVALLVLGPKKLPEIARTLGKGLAEFKKVSTDVQRTINTEVEREEATERKKKAEKELSARKAEAEKTASTAEATDAAPKSAESVAAENAEAQPVQNTASPDYEAEADEQAGAEMAGETVPGSEKKA